MTDTFRALCAELYGAIQLYTGQNPAAADIPSNDLVRRLMDAMAACAAALAQPEAKPEATWRPVRIALAEQPGQVRAWGTTAQLSTEDLAALTQPGRNGIQAKQAIEKLSRLPRHDEQEAHSDADGILLDLLKAIGYEDVADAYKQARKKIGF